MTPRLVGIVFCLCMGGDDLLHCARSTAVAFLDRADLLQGTISFYGSLGVPCDG